MNQCHCCACGGGCRGMSPQLPHSAEMLLIELPIRLVVWILLGLVALAKKGIQRWEKTIPEAQSQT